MNLFRDLHNLVTARYPNPLLALYICSLQGNLLTHLIPEFCNLGLVLTYSNTQTRSLGISNFHSCTVLPTALHLKQTTYSSFPNKLNTSVKCCLLSDSFPSFLTFINTFPLSLYSQATRPFQLPQSHIAFGQNSTCLLRR